MNVAIVASSARDLFAAALVSKLTADGNPPAVVYCAEEPKLKQLRNYFAKMGFRATVAKILDRLQIRESPENWTRHYLRQFCRESSIEFWESVESACSTYKVPFLRIESINAEAAIEQVKAHRVDLLLTTGGEILRKRIISALSTGCLNAHCAELPRFRGYNVMEWSLWHEHRIGVTLHFIDVGIDTGGVLEFRELAVEQNDSIDMLRGKMFPTMVEVMSDGVRRLRAGNANSTPQDPALGKQYFSMHPRLKAIVARKLVKTARHQFQDCDRR